MSVLVRTYTAASGKTEAEGETCDIEGAVRIPLRDGVIPGETTYRPRAAKSGPCILNLSPYNTQRLHDHGAYFARYGYTFLFVDSRGRGNSEGRFRPFIQEALDGHDAVE